MKNLTMCALLLATSGLAGCVETPQTASARKPDVAAYQGGETANVSAGWKVGDAASWEEQTRNRARLGQNEYTRTSAP